jgi:DNA-binding beta-propeller fold protein YncE
MYGRLAVTLAVAATALLPATARGDGLPLPVDDAGPTGVVSPDGSARFVTLPAGRSTVVAKVDTSTGAILASKRVPGHFTIPVVALDSTPGGISHDGVRLALIKPRAGFPRADTTLAFLYTRALHAAPYVFKLRGDFSFDALSPDGRTAYLVQYVNPNDPTKYRVRALDTVTGKLAPRPIVDPHERPDEMNGYPATRTTSPDGRWAYTLYDGAEGTPFVHALDTKAGRARCIDLPDLGQDVYSLHLRASGGTLTIAGPKLDFATIDTATFHVSVPAAGARTAAHHQPGGGGSSAPAALIAGIGLALALAGAGLTVRRRRRGAATPA